MGTLLLMLLIALYTHKYLTIYVKITSIFEGNLEFITFANSRTTCTKTCLPTEHSTSSLLLLFQALFVNDIDGSKILRYDVNWTYWPQDMENVWPSEERI
jgi:hypothetical protein